jgi:HSP20 family protein
MVWRRDPFEEMRRMLDRMERLFEEPWDFGFGPVRVGFREQGLGGFRQPLADVFETDKEVVVTVELPGVNKEDIDVRVTENSVEVKAEVKSEVKEEKEGFYRAERTYEGFYRVIPLPTEVKANEAKATYNNGVLEIRIPKAKEETKAKKVKVE